MTINGQEMFLRFTTTQIIYVLREMEYFGDLVLKRNNICHAVNLKRVHLLQRILGSRNRLFS